VTCIVQQSPKQQMPKVPNGDPRPVTESLSTSNEVPMSPSWLGNANSLEGSLLSRLL
jgi:hypothetical protein